MTGHGIYGVRNVFIGTYPLNNIERRIIIQTLEIKKSRFSKIKTKNKTKQKQLFKDTQNNF